MNLRGATEEQWVEIRGEERSLKHVCYSQRKNYEIWSKVGTTEIKEIKDFKEGLARQEINK